MTLVHVRAHYLVLAQSPTFGISMRPRYSPPPSRGSTAGASRHQRLETEPILSIDRSRSRPLKPLKPHNSTGPSLPSVVTDDRKQFQCLNIVLNDKVGAFLLEFNLHEDTF